MYSQRILRLSPVPRQVPSPQRAAILPVSPVPGEFCKLNVGVSMAAGAAQLGIRARPGPSLLRSGRGEPDISVGSKRRERTRPYCRKRYDYLEAVLMKMQGLNEFLEELESHCNSKAIATFVGSDGDEFAIDLERQGHQVRYGYEPGVKELFLTKLGSRCKPAGSLVLRSFTSETDPLTKLPVKELRGYLLQREGNRLKFEKLSPEMMFACQNTDAQTGEPLPLEQSVKYY